MKGRKKVWFHTDAELRKLIADTLIKVKGALWCDGLMKNTRNDSDTGAEDISDDISLPVEKSGNQQQ